jgi:dihydropyrimidinase
VISRGRIVVQEGRLDAAPGSGQFVPARPSEWARPRGVAVPELARLRELGPAVDL